MFCIYCGKEMEDNVSYCPHCGKAQFSSPKSDVQQHEHVMTLHNIPKCRKCGYVGEFKRENLFRTMDLAIGFATIWFGFGIIYFIVVAILRYDKKNRKTICPHCGEVDSAMDVY